MTMAQHLKKILPQPIAEKLANHSILTIQDYMFMTNVELLRKTGLTYQKLLFISKTVNSYVSPPGIQTSQLLQPSYVIFHDKLDHFLQGGITCGHITEFSGAPGLGKTQLSLQLAVSNTLFGEVNGVLYIDTEGAFSASRLLDIAVHKYRIGTNEDMENCLSKIHVWRPQSLKEIIEKLISMEVLVIKEQIGLLIIDSMGSIVRRDFGSEKSVERGAQMCSLSSSLKRLAHAYNLAVVVTNHVTQLTSKETDTESTTVPALGPSWSHWINSRIHLFTAGNTRRLMICKSPEMPEITVDYRITKGGVEIQYDRPQY